MTIASYSDLKTKAASWVRRAGLASFVAEVPDHIALAEARLNAELGPLETNVSLTGSIGSRSIDISAYTIVEPIALWIAPTGDDEQRLQPQSPANLSFLVTSARPKQWAYDSDSIVFDCPLDTAYPFRFRHRGRFALSDSSTTNWLLESRPDIYLAATLMWGAGYLESWTNGQVWKQLLDEELPKVKHTLAKGRKGTLRVDAALIRNAGPLSLNEFTNSNF